MFEHTETLITPANFNALQPLTKGQLLEMYLIQKDMYGTYLSFATMGSYVAWLGAKVFKFP